MSGPSLGVVCLLETPKFKVGDAPPAGYLAWHDWARVQYNGGYRQRRCGGCGKWRFPQERCCKTESEARCAEMGIEP